MQTEFNKKTTNKKKKKEKREKKTTDWNFFGQVLSFFGGAFRFAAVVLDRFFK
ncbi:TPA: hypothetical protein QCU60_004337 [Bacillus cereus]|nr:hypothetical protein [Bacillus cereus]HDR6312351.1 hypothetical protein [Bacillus cereus]